MSRWRTFKFLFTKFKMWFRFHSSVSDLYKIHSLYIYRMLTMKSIFFRFFSKCDRSHINSFFEAQCKKLPNAFWLFTFKKKMVNIMLYSTYFTQSTICYFQVKLSNLFIKLLDTYLFFYKLNQNWYCCHYTSSSSSFPGMAFQF